MSRKKISIIMAVYKPNVKWLEELLVSLNNQTYDNLELLVWNDSPDEPVDEKLFEDNISAFPYKIYWGERNMGSNYAFEKLTEIAGGEYISYCDQDDVWETDKLDKLIDKLEQDNAVLVYSDLSVIDRNSEQTLDSYQKVSKRQVLLEGEKLFEHLIVRNFIVGCSMIVRADIAKAAVPFEKDFVHDHWLAVYAASRGRISVVKAQLVKYRIHGGNQTGVLGGVTSKKSYFDRRIYVFYNRTKSIYNRFKGTEYEDYLKEMLKWAELRLKYFSKPHLKDIRPLFLKSGVGKSTALFEIMLPFMPGFLFELAVRIIRKGIV